MKELDKDHESFSPLMEKLRDISPPPDGYFADMQDSVWNKLGLENGTEIPEGYFDTLPAAVLEKIREPRLSWKTWLSGVAATLVLVISAYWFIQHSQVPEFEFTEAELAFYYLEENQEEWSLETIVEMQDWNEELSSPLIETMDNRFEEAILQSLTADDVDLELLSEFEDY